MLQYNTNLLDRSHNFNRAGAIGKNLGSSLRNIVGGVRQRRKNDLRQKAFSGYNPDTDPEGTMYRERNKDYYNQLAQNWRTAQEGHEGLQAIQEQERAQRERAAEDRRKKVQDEMSQLSLDSARLTNRVNIIKADQFKNDEIDKTLAYMSQSPERYQAGYSDLQKYFPQELESMGLPQEFNKDAQAKILMRRGVSEKIKELNKAKLKELQDQEDRAFKIRGREQGLGLDKRKMDLQERQLDIAENKYQMEMDKLKKKVAEKKTAPLFEAMSEKEKTYVFDANSTFQNIDNVYRIVNGLDEGKLKGFIRAVQGKSEVLKDPEVQELYSAYQMLTGAITKQIQGARPSDYDAIKYEMATGQRAISKENMKAALDMISNYVAAQTNSVKRSLSKGYGFDPNKVDDLFGETANKYLNKESAPAGSEILNLRKKYNY
jgi:hypothetical protein